MAQKKVEKRVSNAVWQGVATALGIAVFVPLFQMGLKKVGLNIG